MKPLDDILARAKGAPRRIVLPEGEDARILEGARRAQDDGLAQIVLLGAPERVEKKLSELGLKAEGMEILSPAESPKLEEYAVLYHELRKHRGVDMEKARQAMATPLNYAAMMVRAHDADGTLGGAVSPTADVVRAALTIIGAAPQAGMVSSFFLMMLCEHHHTKKGGFVFADCGLVIEPSTQELAQIAAASADSFAHLVGETPRVAMLSFSTGGSAKHDKVTHVSDAAALVREQRPDLTVDGDLQFDTAFVPAISAAKAPDSPVSGEANVMIFPNLEAGNIGYKIAQRIGGAKAIGPILQGLSRPANDLSRGCSADDVYHMLAVTVVQANMQS